MTLRVKNRPLVNSSSVSLRHADLISIAPSPASPATSMSPQGSWTTWVSVVVQAPATSSRLPCVLPSAVCSVGYRFVGVPALVKPFWLA